MTFFKRRRKNKRNLRKRSSQKLKQSQAFASPKHKSLMRPIVFYQLIGPLKRINDQSLMLSPLVDKSVSLIKIKPQLILV